MATNGNPYYLRPEISNSDLTWLDKYWQPQAFIIDLEAAYRFGSLIDAMITEPELVDYFKYSVNGEQYTKEEFEKAAAMKKAFFLDASCKSIHANSTTQFVSIRTDFPITLNTGFSFKLDMRARWDFYCKNIDMGADLKSTACTTQKQFEESIRHFNYDRQAALYMDLGNKSNFMFIGISKVNYKIFKVPIKRGDAIYKAGLDKYRELAFRYWYLFGEYSKAIA